MQTLEKYRVPHNQVACKGLEAALRYYVYLALKVILQKVLESEEVVKRDLPTRDVHNYVNVAVGPRRVAGNRTKKPRYAARRNCVVLCGP